MIRLKKNVKKIISAVIAAASFLCLSSFNVLAAPKYVNITGEPVAVRENPGTSSKFIKQVHYGNQLVYSGEKNDKSGVRWYQVKLSDNKKGWVTSAYSETVDEKEIGRVEVNTKLLNVREKASLTSNVLGIARIGAQFDYMAVTKDRDGQTWYRIHYSDDRQAWLLGTYCKVVKKPGKTASKTNSKTDSKTDPKTGGKQVEITASPVNVRAKASLKSEKVATTNKGKKYKYLASDTDENGRLWYKISYSSGKSGWVLGSLSKFVNNGGTTSTTADTKNTSKTTTQKESKQAEITATVLNVRSKADISGKVLTTVKNGKKYPYLSSEKDSEGKTWYQIEYKTGKKGWILSDYAKLTGGETSSTTTVTQTAVKKVRITGSTVAVRSSASKTAKKLGSVKKGKTFTYLATKKDAKGNKWYQIQYTSKTKGWVLGSLSEVIKAETKATTSAKKAAKQVEIIESPVRVRESPSITAKKVGSTSEGKKYKYLATKKDEKGRTWYQIQYKSDVKGWVLGSFCKLA